MKLFHSPTDWINHYVNRSQTQELDTKLYVQLREEDQKKSNLELWEPILCNLVNMPQALTVKRPVEWRQRRTKK